MIVVFRRGQRKLTVMTSSEQRGENLSAFTLLEFLIILGCVVLLIGLFWPMGRRTEAKAPMTACVSNQKQISLSFIMWINDSEIVDLPWRVPQSEDGTRSATNRSTEAWKEFLSVEKYLPDPRVLACPADKERNRSFVVNWSEGAKGLRNPKYRNNAVSYFLNLDCGAKTDSQGVDSSWLLAQSHVLAGDRNLRVDEQGAICSVGIVNVAEVRTGNAKDHWGSTAWTDSLHNEKGNLAVADGSVVTAAQSTLRSLLSESNDRGSIHLLIP